MAVDDTDADPQNSSRPRPSICIARSTPGLVSQSGDADFDRFLTYYYRSAESRALQHVISLKTLTKTASIHDFWRIFAQGLANAFDAQWGFVSRRVERDDETGEALPLIGEPGSSLLATCWYYDDGYGNHGFGRNVRYNAFQGPCSFMKHNKVLLIPERLPDFVPNDPNAQFLPVVFESYLAIPIFAKGDCIGHFGLIWHAEGAARRELSWGFIEAMLHSVEDLVAQRLVESSSSPPPLPTKGRQEITSLRPYAQALSHELRTPMQGVVGMLDLMHTNLREVSETQVDSGVRKVLRSLKDDIEVIQDSSRRAVEAAENVAHAYDLDMDIPSAASPALPIESLFPEPTITSHSSVNLRFADSSVSHRRGVKRRWSGSGDQASKPRNKAPMMTRPLATYNERQLDIRDAVRESDSLTQGPVFPVTPNSDDVFEALQRQRDTAFAAMKASGNGLQYSKIYELIDYTINESLRVGGRPTAAVGTDTSTGKTIEAVYQWPNGETRTKFIECIIDSSVPETILVHEKNLAKLVSCVFQNALKFTDDGRITVRVSLDPVSHIIIFNVSDTGRGIDPSFQSRIFKPFSKEDNSISRETEGLGLGLLVAKGLSRRLGGDLNLLRSEAEGPNHGSEFEMRIPVFPTEIPSPGSESSRTSADVEGHPTPQTSGQETPNPRHASDSALQTSPRLPTKSYSRPSSPSRWSEAVSKDLASTHPLTFLVAEDNMINRKLLVSMLVKLGYDPKTQIYEAYDGVDALRQATEAHQHCTERVKDGKGPIDVILMDLWMPSMDGYEATERILSLYGNLRKSLRRAINEPGEMPLSGGPEDGSTTTPHVGHLGNDPKMRASTLEPAGVLPPTIMAITADATEGAAEQAAKAGMEGVMAKPFKLKDLEKLVREGWGKRARLMSKAGLARFGTGGLGDAAATVT